MRDAAPSQAIERRELRLPPVQGRDGPLGLLQVRPAEGAPHPIPVVLLHGATFGSAMFDIPVPGYSFQAFLAARGWNNFALDVRGYGRSGPCPVLDAPPEENPPYARLDDAVEDLAAGVRLALEESGAATAHVVGFSWGTVVASAFAERYPALIERLVLYAPLHGEVNDLWIERIGDPDDRTRVNPRLGAYRWVGLEDIVSRWDSDIPAGRSAEDYREPRVLSAILEALAGADPKGRDRPQPSFRAPTGALVDLFEVFSGRPLFDPAAITARTLVIRGEDDTTSTSSDALALFGALGAAQKRYVTISPGSHFLCAERNAVELFGEIDLFLRQ